MSKLLGKVKTWSLSENPEEGEKYFTSEIIYGEFRKYFHTEVYNPLNNNGEQRIAKDRHVNNLKSAICNFNYTPQCFNISVTDESIINIDDKGNVILPLYEDNKLVILDGGSRFAALENIRASSDSNAKMVDLLPIPLIVYLDPSKRKQNFLNLNNGTRVNKSHTQAMAIAGGRVDQKKLETFRRADSVVKLLNSTNSSPLKDLVTFGNADESGKIQYSQLITDHKGSLIASTFGTAKLLNALEQGDQWLVYQFTSLYEMIKERTDYTDSNKLLSLPPDGAKGNVAHILSVLNTTIYFLYLKEQINQSGELEDNDTHILESLKVYDSTVSGDVSRKRRQLLSQGYAQRLFAPLEEVDELPTGMHFGIPISLLVLTSESSFSIEMLPSTKKSRTRRVKGEDNENE